MVFGWIAFGILVVAMLLNIAEILFGNTTTKRVGAFIALILNTIVLSVVCQVVFK